MPARLSIYAGCGNEAVSELIDVVVAEIRRLKADGLAEAELRRAKDHLKGSLMLNLESTSSRMSHLARQEIYRRSDRHARRDARGDRAGERRGRAAARATSSSSDGCAGVTVLGNVNGLQLTRAARTGIGQSDELNCESFPIPYDCPLHPPRDGPHLERAAQVRNVAPGRAGRRRGDGGGRHRARPRPHATCARRAASTSRASKRSRRSRSTTSSRSRRRSPKTSAPRRAGCTSASPRRTSSTPRRRCRWRGVRPHPPGPRRLWPRRSRTRAFEHRRTPMIGRTHGVHAEPMTFGLEAGAVVRRARRATSSACGARARSCGRQDLRRRRHLRASRSVDRGRRLPAAGARAGADFVAGDSARSSRRAAVARSPSPPRRSRSSRSRFAGCRRPRSARSRSRSARARRARRRCRTSAIRSAASRSSGLARLIRANAMAALENIALWHERDISHSSVERVILPDSFIALDHMLRRFTRIVDGHGRLPRPDAREPRSARAA